MLPYAMPDIGSPEQAATRILDWDRGLHSVRRLRIDPRPDRRVVWEILRDREEDVLVPRGRVTLRTCAWPFDRYSSEAILATVHAQRSNRSNSR